MALALNQLLRSADGDYPVTLLHSICCLAGEPEFLTHSESRGKHSLAAAIERHDTAALFDWLVQALSYQGIAHRIALRLHATPWPRALGAHQSQPGPQPLLPEAGRLLSVLRLPIPQRSRHLR